MKEDLHNRGNRQPASFGQNTILIAGADKVAFSLTVCLMQAGYAVTLYTPEVEKAQAIINTHFTDLKAWKKESGKSNVYPANLEYATTLSKSKPYKLAIAIAPEKIAEKKAVIAQLEQIVPAGTLIAISTESIALSNLQAEAQHPERIIGANWVEPVHTTRFLEIIRNDQTNPELVESFCQEARSGWQKDPYVVKESGIRSRMMAALVREAFYLIENGYVGVEDIDRACRNDAGYYMPFAGNFRYMDLMGTYAYGMVMKDLNPELSKDQHLPGFFAELVEQGGKGIENNKGFYNYDAEEVANWEAVFRRFSYQIQEIIQKYPFNYTEANPVASKALA